MACSIILVPHVKCSLEIEKKYQKPMDLKNLRSSPKGSPRKEDGGECFAPCHCNAFALILRGSAAKN